jgi:SAM-dependent methyltransferase
MNKAEWYVDWFNSPYYHLLYSNRDEQEARFFIDNLCSKLSLPRGAKIWDLACGKGRHALELFRKGFEVTGTDLSVNSIAEASLNATEGLQFLVHDMREPFFKIHFDAVFNLFTSIGYFKEKNDNYAVFKNVSTALKPSGVFVVDFFNAEKVRASIVPEQTIQRNGIEFLIKKTIQNNAVTKRIEFSDRQKNYYFEEHVSLLGIQDFESFAFDSGLELFEKFGNYKLEPFDIENSDRLILLFKKSLN